ncbi:hypothetical protein GCM10022245_49120 [Streptomyces mayteni]
MVPRAARTRRICAWLVDYAVVVLVAVQLAVFTFHRISAQLTDATGLAGTTAWEVVTSDGDLVGAGRDVGESVWWSAVAAVWQAFAALVVLTFVYHFVSLALAGRTPGQALLALSVVPRGGEGRPGPRRSAVRAAVVTAADVGWYALACCLLVGGAGTLSVLCWTVAVLCFALNAWLALAGSRRSLADRLSGTTVGSAWRVGAALGRVGGLLRRRPDPSAPAALAADPDGPHVGDGDPQDPVREPVRLQGRDGAVLRLRFAVRLPRRRNLGAEREGGQGAVVGEGARLGEGDLEEVGGGQSGAVGVAEGAEPAADGHAEHG